MSNLIFDENCIFCKIIKGEIPSYKVYEDEQVLAFLDITPVNLGHTLVISKNHYTSLEDIPEDEFLAVMRIVKKLGNKIKTCLNLEGYNLGLNNGEVAGQTVPHVHFHIMPRKSGDGYQAWHGKEGYSQEEMEDVLESIKL